MNRDNELLGKMMKAKCMDRDCCYFGQNVTDSCKCSGSRMNTTTPPTPRTNALLSGIDSFGNIPTMEDRFQRMCRHARELERELTAASKWILVSERLPEIGVNVLTASWAHNKPNSERVISIMQRGEPHEHGEWWERDTYIGDNERYPATHWKPIEPPKE